MIPLAKTTLPLLELASLASTAFAACECGFSVNQTSTGDFNVYTDLIETNFLTGQNISWNTDWIVQRHWNDADERRPYGRNYTAESVVSNPVVDNSSLAGPSKLGGPAGLQIWVRGGEPPNGRVPSGEIRTARKDILYGSFRIAARLTPVNGTCSAMFAYYNDSQEIDMELLSQQYMQQTDPPASPLNLVVHTPESSITGFQEANTSTYGMPVVPVSFTDSFNEFRFDWMPGRVVFYLNGNYLWELEDSNVPITASSMLLAHWSNGTPGWSLGPPAEDAVMVVSYFKAYFNSTDPQRGRDHSRRCVDPAAPDAICEVPDQIGAPGFAPVGSDSGAAVDPFFFSGLANHTVNQTVFTGYESDAIRVGDIRSRWAWVLLGAFVMAFSWSGCV